MRQIKLSLEKALEWEAESILTLYTSQHSHIKDLIDHPAERWFANYQSAVRRYRKVSIGDIFRFIDPEYIIEIPLPYEPETNTFSWAYIHGKLTNNQKKLEQLHSKAQYVYVLTNPAYPDLVKIGKAVNPQSRIKQINGAGTVHEWKLYWAIPVTDDYTVENLAHRHFQDRRVDSDQGSSREFFEVNVNEAIQAIEYLAQDYVDGDPTFY